MSGVLVTGATTPIGRRLVRELADDPRFGTIVAVAVEREPEGLDGERIAYHRCDLTRGRDLRDLLFGPVLKHQVTAVVHSALHRSATDTGPKVRALNVECTRELLQLAEDHPTIQRFVYRSYGDVYRIDPRRPTLVTEDHPLEMSPGAPQRVRDRVEADVTVATRTGLSRLGIAVLRCAEVLAAESGSQLYDYLGTTVCLRPAGFDPMLNVLSLADAVRATRLALDSDASGLFNIPGADTLPLSKVIARWGRVGVALPGPMLAPLYRLRASTLGMEFRYDMNHRRFHFSSILDGTRAKQVLNYEPREPIAWPR